MTTMQQAPIQYSTDVQRVTVVTGTLIIEGNIYLAKVGKDDRRLTTFLNSDKKFVAMTDVVVVDRLSSAPKPVQYPFIEVNMATVEYIKPHRPAANQSASPSQGAVSDNPA